jgi:hypothetical protein
MSQLVKNVIVMTGATLLVATAAGCKNDAKTENADSRIHGEMFLAVDAPREINAFTQAQTASGARSDGMLGAYCFDRGALNSTGEEKLGLMIDDDDLANPMVVYVDVPQDDLWSTRVDSITKYCKAHALGEAQVQVVRGPNPGAYRAVAPGVAAIKADAAAPAGPSVTEGGSTSMK